MTVNKPRHPSVTPKPWKHLLQHECYGTAETYRLAAEWLGHCPTVADWGGGSGVFRTFLPPSVHYTLVDGTLTTTDQVLADVTAYHEPSDGILVRHVLELNVDWRTILQNALAAFRQRMVVVTHTPWDAETAYVKHKSGWPIHNLSQCDVVDAIWPQIVKKVYHVQTTHPETVYYLEKPCGS